MEILRQHAEKIFLAGLKAVLPRQIITQKLNLNRSLTPNVLQIENKSFEIQKNVYVVGFGKAVMGMARAVEELLADHIVRGIINIPIGMQDALRNSGKIDQLLASNTKIQIFEGAKNNLPDHNAVEGATKIVELVKQLQSTDLLIVLISGGGSALLPVPIPPISLEDKIHTIQVLSQSGATIQELNTVRQQISLVKGGGLAKLAHPAQVLSLVLSDVINDPLEFIASGPTTCASGTPETALSIIKKYRLEKEIPNSTLDSLSSKGNSSERENIDVSNFMIGNNSLAMSEASRCAESLDYFTIPLSNTIEGPAEVLSKFLVQLAIKIHNMEELDNQIYDLAASLNIPRESMEKFKAALTNSKAKSLCLMTAGETTVTVKGKGIGGRNQELVLASCIALHRHFSKIPDGFSIALLSAGTDGIDGPTPAAGSVTYMEQYRCARQQGLDPEKYLQANDSYSFYKEFGNGRDLIMTGHTGTNVMDIQVLLISRNNV